MTAWEDVCFGRKCFEIWWFSVWPFQLFLTSINISLCMFYCWKICIMSIHAHSLLCYKLCDPLCDLLNAWEPSKLSFYRHDFYKRNRRSIRGLNDIPDFVIYHELIILNRQYLVRHLPQDPGTLDLWDKWYWYSSMIVVCISMIINIMYLIRKQSSFRKCHHEERGKVIY